MRTVASVEKELREKLLHWGTRIRESELKSDTLAWCEYEGPKTDIVLDRYRGGFIECTVHELMHSKHRKALSYWGSLEEATVLAVEAEVMHLINMDADRVKWWREAIGAKLAREGD